MSDWQWWTAMTFIAAVVLGSIVVIATLPAATATKEMRLCDKAVATVLSSTDPVELQRASIIVRNLHCAIGLRLDEAGAFKPRAEQ